MTKNEAREFLKHTKFCVWDGKNRSEEVYNKLTELGLCEVNTDFYKMWAFWYIDEMFLLSSDNFIDDFEESENRLIHPQDILDIEIEEYYKVGDFVNMFNNNKSIGLIQEITSGVYSVLDYNENKTITLPIGAIELLKVQPNHQPKYLVNMSFPFGFVVKYIYFNETRQVYCYIDSSYNMYTEDELDMKIKSQETKCETDDRLTENDLQVNDLVYYNENVLNEDEYANIEPIRIVHIRNGEDIELAIENCYTAIKLTDEIIYLNEFVLSNRGVFNAVSDDGKHLFFIDKKSDKYGIVLSGRFVEIKYVHELQHILRVCGFKNIADNFKY